MELEKIIGEEIIYQYLLTPEEVRDYTADPNFRGWALLEVHPETQVVHSYYFNSEEKPTLRDIARIRDWKEENFDEVTVWLHDRDQG